MAIKEGAPAPDVELETESGEKLRLSSLRGRKVILYFYPKADTPGCTREACEFRDNFPNFEGQDAIVIGVSPDTPAAQSKFKTKYELPFTLLADVNHKAAEAFGVWVEKSMYGRKYMGVERSTFLIDEDGKIAKVFAKVKPAGHAEQVLEALKAL
jgi:Peroxiredoxin